MIMRILTAQVEKHKTPSVKYIIFDKDRVIYIFQAGMADIKGQIKQKTTVHRGENNLKLKTKHLNASSCKTRC